ncbi:MAG: nuclear transport factor 2 family protein [Methanoregula sp.]|nr:nuclear transport factor 2 family protein [Methanoregula sp.]
MISDTADFAQHWIAAWNSHDLDRIMEHYAQNVEVTTPMIKVMLGIDSGTLKGKDKVREYWRVALQKVPDLHFEYIDVTQSVGSIALYYNAILGKRCIEVMFLNEVGKIEKVVVHYT